MKPNSGDKILLLKHSIHYHAGNEYITKTTIQGWQKWLSTQVRPAVLQLGAGGQAGYFTWLKADKPAWISQSFVLFTSMPGDAGPLLSMARSHQEYCVHGWAHRHERDGQTGESREGPKRKARHWSISPVRKSWVWDSSAWRNLRGNLVCCTEYWPSAILQRLLL